MLKKKIIVNDSDVDDIDLEQTNCCGIYELHSLSSSAVDNIVKLGEDMTRNYPMIIFHDRISYLRGSNLARYIEQQKLGTLVRSKKLVNPNTGAKIQMWIFYPNWKAIDKFLVGVLIRESYGAYRKPFRIRHVNK